MKILTFLIALTFATLVSSENFISLEDLSAFNYHSRIGIPLAAKIKRSEEDAARTGQRIVGGVVTDVSQVPYQAGLVIQFTWFTSVCGGSLISNTRVITAAHCQWDGNVNARSHTVVLGSNTIFSGGIRRPTSDVVMHPGWNVNTLANDIAVMRIAHVGYTTVIQPIALPSGNELSQTFAGQIALASGFGYTRDDGDIPQNQVISSVNIPIITNAECRAYFGPFAHDTNICTSAAGGRGVCHGDSGGPLAVQSSGRTILVGVTSYGGYSGCEGGTYNGYTRVTSFVPWILSL